MLSAPRTARSRLRTSHRWTPRDPPPRVSSDRNLRQGPAPDRLGCRAGRRRAARSLGYRDGPRHWRRGSQAGRRRAVCLRPGVRRRPARGQGSRDLESARPAGPRRRAQRWRALPPASKERARAKSRPSSSGGWRPLDDPRSPRARDLRSASVERARGTSRGARRRSPAPTSWCPSRWERPPVGAAASPFERRRGDRRAARLEPPSPVRRLWWIGLAARPWCWPRRDAALRSSARSARSAPAARGAARPRSSRATRHRSTPLPRLPCSGGEAGGRRTGAASLRLHRAAAAPQPEPSRGRARHGDARRHPAPAAPAPAAAPRHRNPPSPPTALRRSGAAPARHRAEHG